MVRAILLTSALLVLAVLSASGGAGALTAQSDVAGASSVLAQAQGGPGAADLPVRPRNMRPYWHVFLSFAVAWLLLLGYAVALGRRFNRLEEELQRLRGT